jgi:hypothetical protein
MAEEEERLKRKHLLMSYYNQTTNNASNELTNKDNIETENVEASSFIKKMYESQPNFKDPIIDVNLPNFEFDLFLKKLIKVKLFIFLYKAGRCNQVKFFNTGKKSTRNHGS